MVVQVEVQVAVKQARVPGVADHPVSVRRFLIESQRHAGKLRHGLELQAVHVFRRPGVQDALALVFSVLQMGDHEAAQVRTGRRQGARRRHLDKLERTRVARTRPVALRHVRRPALRQGLLEGRMGHAERREDVLRDVVLEPLSGDALHDVAGQGCAIVRVGRRGPGREDPRGHRNLSASGSGS